MGVGACYDGQEGEYGLTFIEKRQPGSIGARLLVSKGESTLGRRGEHPLARAEESVPSRAEESVPPRA